MRCVALVIPLLIRFLNPHAKIGKNARAMWHSAVGARYEVKMKSWELRKANTTQVNSNKLVLFAIIVTSLQ